MTKYGPALRRGAGVEHLRDRRMGHDRERLPLGLESRDDLGGVHSRLDHFDRDMALDRAGLLGEPDLAHSTGADRSNEPIRTDRFETEPAFIVVRDVFGLRLLSVRFFDHG